VVLHFAIPCGQKATRNLTRNMPSPHFSPAFYCGGGSGHVYCVPLRRAPRRTVEYACGALGRAPCIHTHLRRIATKPGEKCGLEIQKQDAQLTG
jgi:hypothetical protein